MSRPNVLVLRAPGTNCDEETAFAFEKAGAKAERVHINRLLEDAKLLDRFQVLCIPGGFSYGDDVAAGRILANQLSVKISETLRQFRDKGNLILGICNGFQVLIKSGLLMDETDQGFPATLTWNNSGQYEDRWVHLKSAESPCVFLNGSEQLYLPVAHAEGRFAVQNKSIYEQLNANNQLALRYSTAPQGASNGNSNGNSNGHTNRQSNGVSELPFPLNPNGSVGNVAGVCDSSGRVFGLMPHPERFIERTQHPHWTRLGDELAADGLQIFSNAVKHFS